MRPVRAVVAAAVLLAALVVQVAVLARLPLPGATPDLVLVVVVALAVGYGPRFGAGAGFAAGLASDLVPPADSAAGRWALVFALVGYGAGLVSSRMRRSVLVPVLVVGMAAAVSIVGYAATALLVGDAPVAWNAVNPLVPTGVLYAVVLSAFVVPAVLAVVRRLEPDPPIEA